VVRAREGRVAAGVRSQLWWVRERGDGREGMAYGEPSGVGLESWVSVSLSGSVGAAMTFAAATVCAMAWVLKWNMKSACGTVA
jgi:hypothetical protein